MPARRKPAGTVQDRRPQRSSSLVVMRPASDVEVPAAPAGLLKSSEERWAAFWRSPSAAASEDVDLAVAERWILARDEWQRSLNAVRRKRLVEGSMGQPVLNPLTSWVAGREAEMHRCETELGIGAKSRSNLGITVGQAKLTAAELNRMTMESDRGPAVEIIDVEEAELLEEFPEA